MSANRNGVSADVQHRMRTEWDARARENAFYYIASSREDWSPEDFYASGVESVRATVLNDMQLICQGRDPKTMKVLEIGCGAGRMTRALAGIFGEVHGVDVSGEMIAQGQRLLANIPNAHLHQNNGFDLAVLGNRKFDFVFSFIVFQHIPRREVIQSYVREAARRLNVGGTFKFQVQGHPAVSATEGDTWIGVSFSYDDALQMVDEAGLMLRHTEGAGEQYFWLWASKPPAWRVWLRGAREFGWFERLRSGT